MALQVAGSSTGNAVDVFKKPEAPAVKKARRKVLDEDDYVQEMENIIQRDFFPDLERLQAQNEYLDAVETNDVQRLREIAIKYSSGKRPDTERYASPATFETPVDVRRDNDLRPEQSSSRRVAEDSDKSEGKKGKNLRLNEYLNAYTSEDNQSFQEMMEESEKQHRVKFAWLYDAEEKHKQQQLDYMQQPSIEQQADFPDRPLQLDTWAYRSQNHVMYVPDGVPFSSKEMIELSKKTQDIAYGNTRFEANPFSDQQNKEKIKHVAQIHAKSKEGKIGVDGKELVQTDTPEVNGYSFVKTPSPAPGVNETPLMTWGEIEGTPFRLDGGDTPITPAKGPSFKIAEPAKREKIALRLAEKASQKNRDKKTKAMQVARSTWATPSPRPMSVMDRMTVMSPAAQRLATSKLKLRVGTDKSLRASYTPVHYQPTTPGGAHTPASLRSGSLTPSSRTPTRTPSKRIDPSTLTDNLLQLPTRAKAADYF